TDRETAIARLALRDMDGDGNLDLFVGGRVIARRYPEPASSRIYRHGAGGWQLDLENTRALEKAALVSSAVWSDLDGDGFPELILACEWGPIRIFHNDHGRLTETNYGVSSRSADAITHQLSTINQLRGWWTGIATADLDADG